MMNRAERLRSLGVLFTVVAVVIIFFGYKAENFYSKNPLWSILFGLSLVLIILLTFFWGSIDEYYKDRKNKKNELSNTVISKKSSTVYILDKNGENATYFEKLTFHKVGSQNNSISRINSDDANKESYITNPQLVNCNTNFVEKAKSLKIYFKDDTEQLNEVKSSYKVEQFLYFSVELRNCFTNKVEESWQLSIANYCKEFEQKIVFPEGITIEQVKLYRIENENKTIVTAVTPFILKEENRNTVYLYLTNLDKNEIFELRWIYSK